MQGNKSVSLERVIGRENEYIIRDFSGITIGRIYIIEMVKENKNCTLRMRLYKNDEKILSEVLLILLRILFKSQDISKVNLIVDEVLDIKAFTSTGFTLEGILESNIYSNNDYRSELIFGITFKEFNKGYSVNILNIKGKKVSLKLLTPEDSKDILDYCIRNKEHLAPYEPLRDESFYTLEEQRRILIEEYKQYLNGTSLNCGIYKQDKLIGKIRLSNIIYGGFKNCFLGYSIDEKEQGRGNMKEAVSLIVDYAFEEMELHRVEASTLTDNYKSQGVLKGCGFEELGISKEYLYINGGWRDHINFYKIRRR
jgi:[ribosomal protein S5]-alanine N-acetyltransferase